MGSLKGIIKGKQKQPIRTMLYGPEGIGKSTFASNSPSPIFLDMEDGTSNLDVDRFPRPTEWGDVVGAVELLRTQDHEYKTLVIDTLDAVEPLIWSFICDRDDKVSIEDYGYGKGYVVALGIWREFILSLDRLRKERGMHILLLAHTQIRTFKNPEGDDFDRFELKLHLKAGGFIKDWSENVLFANYETLIKKEGLKAKGVGGKARFVWTSRRAAWDAKNRFDLPEKLPLDWSDYQEAMDKHHPADPEELKKSILEKLTRVDDKSVVKWVNDRIGTATASELAKIENRLSAKLSEREGENNAIAE